MKNGYETIGKVVVGILIADFVVFGIGIVENAIEKRYRKKARKRAGVIDIKVVREKRAK
jgi:hypothetical protein